MSLSRDDHMFDDWEDIADDNLSVISLPTSEGAADAGHLDSLSPVACIVNDLATLTIHNESHMEMEGQEPESESNAASPPSPANPASTNLRQMLMERSNQRRPATEFSHGHEAFKRDNLELSIDPTFLALVCANIVKFIDDRRLYPRNSVCRDFNTICKSVKDHLQDLSHVMAKYGNYWSSDATHVTLPIDHGLYEWLSVLRADFLGAQALVQSQLGSRPTDPPTITFLTELAVYGASLNEFRHQMATFIPIMKADYEKFSAKYPSEEVEEVVEEEPVAAGHRTISLPPLTRPNPPHHHDDPNGRGECRHQIALLKKEISGYGQELRNFASRQPCSANSRLGQLQESYRQLEMTLEDTMRQHGDVISDHGGGGGGGGNSSTMLENLHANEVRSLNVRLKEIGKNFYAERDRARTVRLTGDQDMMLDDMAEEDQQKNIQDLEELYTVVSGVFSMPAQRPEW